jgi:hypothetical protein
MMKRAARLLNALLAVPLLASAQPAPKCPDQQQGTQQEKDACKRDVRRFCSKVRSCDPMEYLKCLELNRDSLSKACLGVLVDHGR